MKKLSLLLLVCMVSMLAFAQSDSPSPDDSSGGGPIRQVFSQDPASGNDLTPGRTTLTPGSWNYGEVAVEYPGEAIFTLTNNSSNDITIYSIKASPTPPFKVIPAAGPTYCGVLLKSGSHCLIAVQFLAKEPGLKTGTLTVTDSADDSPQTANLSGTAIPDVTLTPSSCNFGGVFVGYSGYCTVTLTNNAPTTLHISSVEADPNPPFSANNGCGKSVAAYQSCYITVVFTPDRLGEATGTLTVTDDSLDNSPASLGLSGYGVLCNPKFCQPPQ